MWVRPNQHPYLYSLGIAASISAAALIAFAISGAVDLAYVSGRLMGGALINMLISGSIARASSHRLRWWEFLVLVVAVGAAVTFVTALGANSGQGST